MTIGPSPADLRRWRRHLANERAEAAVYRDLASRYDGEEREILASIASAEERHEQHWLSLLGEQVGEPVRADFGTRALAFMARHFGSVFVLALVQRFEARASYERDADATPTMAADEQIHEEVIRALAARGRDRLSGSFRAAVFGANDGLVSNLALILGVAASGVDNHTVLVTGLAGLLAGALSMGAGEYVSVSSQRELLEASAPSPNVGTALTQLDVDANELELVYRARGMSAEEAKAHADKVLREACPLRRLALERRDLQRDVGRAHSDEPGDQEDGRDDPEDHRDRAGDHLGEKQCEDHHGDGDANATVRRTHVLGHIRAFRLIGDDVKDTPPRVSVETLRSPPGAVRRRLSCSSTPPSGGSRRRSRGRRP